MKRIYILSFLLILFTLPLWSGTIVKTITFQEKNLVFSKINGYDVVELKGYPALINPGAPRLPHVVQSLIIPAGAKPTKVEIISQDVVNISGTYHIVPAHPDVPLPMIGINFTPEEVLPDLDVYASNDLYPEAEINIIGVGTKNGYRIAHVEMFPLRYIPLRGTLQLATRITYSVEYTETQIRSTIPTLRQKEMFGEVVTKMVANPEDVLAFAPNVASGLSISQIPPGYYEYVIISETPMDTVFQRLANWKTKKGIPATVVTVSWINSNYSGFDLQEKIRNFIIDAWINWGTIYVLLGGSGDQKTSGENIVPARRAFYTVTQFGAYPDEDTIPSDLYYSDLDGNWDLNENHVWGELSDSVDMYAEVYIGRASVYNVSMAQNFVHKVLTYEKNPPTGYIKKMMLATAMFWGLYYNEMLMQDSIADMTPVGWFDAKMYERNGNLSRQSMIDSMNVGYGMGNWEGHGGVNGICLNGPGCFFYSEDADSLVNGDRVGIANSIACFNGAWDESPRDKLRGIDCLAEHLVNRVGGGLVAAMMNSRFGYGGIIGREYVPGPSERLDTTFFHNIFHSNIYHIGVTHAIAKDAWVPYADSSAQYRYTRWVLYTLNLFGDPEMPLWTDEPESMKVTHDNDVSVGTNNFTVTVRENYNITPIANALVCLMGNTDTGLYGTGYTNASGTVIIPITVTIPDDTMWVTVTAQNHYPYEGYTIVPGITESSETLDRINFKVNSLVKGKAIFRFSIPESSKITLKIYDVTGRVVSELLTGSHKSGDYQVFFKPTRKGIYFYRLESSYKITTGKFVIF